MTAWTMKELLGLTALRQRGATYVECAAALPGRTPGGCARMAKDHGLTDPGPDAAERDHRRKMVARWHAAGLTPYQMIARFRRSGVAAHPDTLYRIHQAIGLTPHRIDLAERGRRAQVRCWLNHGSLPGQIHCANERANSFTAGWPACSAAAVRHLAAFFDHGSATAPEHAARIGQEYHGVRSRLLKYRGAGWLVKVGSRDHFSVYNLAAEVRARRQAWITYRSDDIPT